MKQQIELAAYLVLFLVLIGQPKLKALDKDKVIVKTCKQSKVVYCEINN